MQTGGPQPSLIGDWFVSPATKHAGQWIIKFSSEGEGVEMEEFDDHAQMS